MRGVFTPGRAMEHCCCWQKESIGTADCPYLQTGDEELLFSRKKRLLRYCLDCPRFLKDLEQTDTAKDGLTGLFPYVVEELQTLRVRVRDLTLQAEAHRREIKFLHEVGLVLQTSVDVDEVIAMALTAVTAGKGFGFNRAILLQVDKNRQHLNGYFAVGPRRREEAGHIWQDIARHNYSLREMARLFFETGMDSEREKFRDLLETLSVPMSDSGHLFVRTLNEQQSRHIPDLAQEPALDQARAAALGVRELLLVPLVSKNRRIGLLLADNHVNGHPISEEDLRSLENFALPVSFAIERAALYERLQEELAKVTEANERLRQQQEQILRMEKMALVGKIAANIAHSIRNPLTIIGGFARNLSNGTPPEDARQRYIESIVHETKHLEEVLGEVLTYAESMHPSFDRWDLNHLVTGVYTAMRSDLEKSGINCRLELQPGLPPVWLDFKKISYCLRSLLNNALEALAGKGNLEIRTARLGEQAVLTISDDGPGMDTETLQAAVTPFFSTKERGTGLGLSLCAGILREHGTDLEIDSEAGRGTTFTIRMDISREDTDGSHPGR